MLKNLLNHSFNVSLAKEIGLNESIIMQHFAFWHQKNMSNDKHYIDGHYWTYNSVAAFNDIFPYFTYKEIRGALDRMLSEGLIKVGNFNRMNRDRTKWYSLTVKACELIGIPFDKKANENCEKGESICKKGKPLPDLNTDNKPDLSLLMVAQSESQIIFENAWQEYLKMRKKKRQPATEHAESLILKKLNNLTGNDVEKKTQILLRSIERSWTDVYPLPENHVDISTKPISKKEKRNEDYNSEAAKLDNVDWEQPG